MKQIVILGLSYFGKSVLEELLDLDVEILIVDKDQELIDSYKDSATAAVVLNVLNFESLQRVLPKSVDAVIIDMGDNIEGSILATSYCGKLGVPSIVVKAETEAHAEILDLVGATKVVFPNREAAKRVTRQLISPGLLNYLPLSGNIVIAEIEIPEGFVGMTVLETDLRRKYGLNLISVKNGEQDYGLFVPEYRFQAGDIGLVSGTDAALEVFTGSVAKGKDRSGMVAAFKKLFSFGRK